MILIKLGGSIITNKQRPLSPRRKTIHGIARVLATLDEPAVLVHGGGSFGHHWSVMYDMHTKPQRYDSHGVAVVKNSMIDLNRIVVEILLKNKLNPYCLQPAYFMQGNKPVPERIAEMAKISKSGLLPVTFGDALWYGQNKTYILSGDVIMTHLSQVLNPRLCIFALNVDGLYGDPDAKKLITEFENQRPSMSKNKMDVTGGMARKVREAVKISKTGIDVFFVNGTKPERIAMAVNDNKFHGTIFGGRRNV